MKHSSSLFIFMLISIFPLFYHQTMTCMSLGFLSCHSRKVGGEGSGSFLEDLHLKPESSWHFAQASSFKSRRRICHYLLSEERCERAIYFFLGSVISQSIPQTFLSSLSAGLVVPPWELSGSRCIAVPGSRERGRQVLGPVALDLFQCEPLIASRKSHLAS